ncbi:MAG: AmmeMemoRadiSam system radical SAM enzyme [Bacillota bacterium]
MQLASWFIEKEDNKVICQLCPHVCHIPENDGGKCRVRVNKEGRLYSANYGKATAINLDPMEKKPLYHFYPGKNVLSLGTFGCNLHCDFCQNWQIAHEADFGRSMLPQEVAELAHRYYVNQNSAGVAYTYSEPGMWYEFVVDTAPLVSEYGLVNVLVTNGYLNKKPFLELLKHVHAFNIDVKAFTDKFYKEKVCGTLKPVLDNCAAVVEKGRHLEITTLIIPGLNDSASEIEELARWIASLDPNIPLHLSRYYPNYKMHIKATPLDILEQAWETAREYLGYVYIGNAPELDKSDTLCPVCGKVLIKRSFYNTYKTGYEGGKCLNCQNHIRGIVE